jgi:hypothetical protein
MRSCVLVVSLTALCLAFAGAVLGVRPRPVQAEAESDAVRLRVLEARVSVLTGALEDLERRLEEHRFRTPAASVEAPVSAPAATDSEPVEPDVPTKPPAPEPGPEDVLKRAAELLDAGDAGGARILFAGLADSGVVPFVTRVRARLGLASTWEAVENRDAARAALEALKRDLEEAGSRAALLEEVGARLAGLSTDR